MTRYRLLELTPDGPVSRGEYPSWTEAEIARRDIREVLRRAGWPVPEIEIDVVREETSCS